MVPKLPSVALGSASEGAAEIDLSEVIEPNRAICLVVMPRKISLLARNQYHHVLSCWTSLLIGQCDLVMTRGLA